MKIANSVLLVIISGCFFSCNNSQNKSLDNSKQRQDSIHWIDSVKTENVYRDEREKFRTSMVHQIDSMNFELTHIDSLVNQNGKISVDWQNNKDRIRSRMERLNKKQFGIGNVAKKDWENFKRDIDSAFVNLKKDLQNVKYRNREKQLK